MSDFETNNKRPGSTQSRRGFLSKQIKLAVLGAFIGTPLSSLFRVRFANAEETSPAKKITVGGIKKGNAKDELHPMAKPFIDEYATYEISFIGLINVAEGFVKFYRDDKGYYVGHIEAKVKGLAAKLSEYKLLGFKSHMRIKDVDGKPRFVSSIHTREQTKGDEKKRSVYKFNYFKKTWSNERFKNGKLYKTRRRKFKVDAIDDFVSAAYNFRAGAMGPVEAGKKYTINVIPFSGIDKFYAYITSPDEMKKEGDWVKKYDNAKWLAILKVDKKLFGKKDGSVKFLGDKDLFPLACRVDDATYFGNVQVHLVSRKDGIYAKK